MQNNTRKPRSKKALLGEEERESLLWGRGFPFKNEKARRQCWNKHRAELMESVGKEIPFSDRPLAFWDYEAKVKRAVSSEKCKLVNRKGVLVVVTKEDAPHSFKSFEERCEILPRYNWETKSDFLKSRGLLLPGEGEYLS